MIKLYLLLSHQTATEPPFDPFTLSGDAAAQRLRQLCPDAIGYVQTRALADQIRPEQPSDYAGVLELWFADVLSATAAAQNPSDLAPLWNADLSALAELVVGHERIVMRLPSQHTQTGVKGVFPFRRKPGMSVADFQHHWWHNHGPIAALTEQALYYVQCHVLDHQYRQTPAPAFDGITELHWPSLQAARDAMASRQMVEDQSTDAKHFVEDGSVALFLAEEEVVIAP